MFKRFFKNSKGMALIEYALIASLIAMIAISGIKFIGNELNNKFTTVANGMNNGSY